MTDVVDHIQKIDSDSVNDMTFRHFKVCGNFLTWYSSLDDLSLYGAYTKRNTLIGRLFMTHPIKLLKNNQNHNKPHREKCKNGFLVVGQSHPENCATQSCQSFVMEGTGSFLFFGQC